MNLKINHLQHIGMPITDIDVSTSFYEKLGFKVVMRSTFMHEGSAGKVAMLQLEKIIIELYQMPEPELSAVKARKDGRIDHIAFDVDDIDEAFLTLKKEGYEILQTEPVYLSFWEKGCKYFYITGPDGERLEFCQIL